MTADHSGRENVTLWDVYVNSGMLEDNTDNVSDGALHSQVNEVSDNMHGQT
jgi:hypothetical protein